MIFTLPDHPCLADYREHADLERNPKTRPIEVVDTICLHQLSAANFHRGIRRWKHKEYHWVVECEDARAYLMHDPNIRTHHGNGFNYRSVGLGVEGCYAGVEGDLDTFWRPAEDPDRQPMHLNCAMVGAIVAAIGATCEMVKAAGGEIKYIGAHRQSSRSRRSDPGSAIWKVALACMENMGLKEAKTLKHGRPIPEAWDPRNEGVRY